MPDKKLIVKSIKQLHEYLVSKQLHCHGVCITNVISTICKNTSFCPEINFINNNNNNNNNNLKKTNNRNLLSQCLYIDITNIKPAHNTVFDN